MNALGGRWRFASVEASCPSFQHVDGGGHEVEGLGGLRARHLAVHVLGAVDECAQDLLHRHALRVPDVAGVPRALALDELQGRLSVAVEVAQGVSMPWVEDPHLLFMGR